MIQEIASLSHNFILLLSLQFKIDTNLSRSVISGNSSTSNRNILALKSIHVLHSRLGLRSENTFSVLQVVSRIYRFQDV